MPSLSRSTFTKYLKLIGELLGWTWIHHDDNHPDEPGERFCDLISSHTARRSFATNAYAAGIPLPSIMAVTGHSSEKNLRIYLKLSRQEKAVIAAADFKGFIHKQ